MQRCKAITLMKFRCSRSAVRNNYCSQHFHKQTIITYKKEIAKMHDRVKYYAKEAQAAKQKLEIIDKVDYLKMKLAKLTYDNIPFRTLIRDVRFKDDLEEIFKAPFRIIPRMYDEMLEERNSICHKYTRGNWY